MVQTLLCIHSMNGESERRCLSISFVRCLLSTYYAYCVCCWFFCPISSNICCTHKNIHVVPRFGKYMNCCCRRSEYAYKIILCGLFCVNAEMLKEIPLFSFAEYWIIQLHLEFMQTKHICISPSISIKCWCWMHLVSFYPSFFLVLFSFFLRKTIARLLWPADRRKLL